MPFCPSCGAEVQGSFCGACGKSVGSAPATSGAPPAATTTGLQDNVASALCYLFGVITGVLFLVLEPYNHNPKVRFHAFQSIFLTIGLVAIQVGLSIVAMMPFLGFVAAAGSTIVALGSFVLWLLLMIKTYGGSKTVLPVIGPMAQKQAG